MGRIKNFLQEQHRRLKHLSIRTTLMLYMSGAVLLVVAMSALTDAICNRWMKVIAFKYEMADAGFASAVLINKSLLDIFDQRLYAFITFFDQWAVVFYSIMGMFAMAHLFYKSKLEEPIGLLLEEASKIRQNELHFSCRFDSDDELGDVCHAVDEMRLALVQNQEKNWELMEEQKRVNAAFAHDLRTPLTVVLGYSDFLSKYYKTGKLTSQQVEENLNLIRNQTSRAIEFTNTMKQITTLEEREIKKSPISFRKMEQKIIALCRGLSEGKTIQIQIQPAEQETLLLIDLHVVEEVLENLLSNALRFANQEIMVSMEEVKGYLYLYVADDGKGFSKEELRVAQNPYYTGNGQETGGKHFGLGLYISTLLCRKHDGNMEIRNNLEGGAYITASFGAKRNSNNFSM